MKNQFKLYYKLVMSGFCNPTVLCVKLISAFEW